MPENKITIAFKHKGDKDLLAAIKALANEQERLNQKYKGYVKGTKKAAMGNRLLANTFATLRAKMLLFSFAMSMGIRQLFGLVKEAGKVEALRHGFEKLSQAGNFATDTLKQLRIATNGTMSDMDLLTQANNAMVLGVAAGTEEMAKMFDGAQRLGRALGRDTQSSIESLVTGIGRQSRLMLDNIGIIVKADEAYKDFAKELGVSVDQLSNLDKKAAFSAATIKSLNDEVAKLGKEVLTNQDKIDKMGVSIANLGVAVGMWFAPAVGHIADFWANWINGANGVQDTMPKTNAVIDKLNGQMRTQLIIQSEAEKAQQKLIKSGKFGLPITTKQTEEYKKLQRTIDGAKQSYKDLNVKLIDAEHAFTTTTQVQTLTKELAMQAELEMQLLHLKDGIITADELQAEINLQLQNAQELRALGLITENDLLTLQLKLKKEGIKIGDIEQKMESDKIKLAGKGIKVGADILALNSKNAKEVAQLQALATGVNAFAAASDAFAQAAKNPLTIANPMYPNIVYGLTLAQGLAASASAFKAADKMEQGGLIGGRRHSSGGTMINAEQGEFVMSRNAVNAVGVEAMNRINAGGGAGAVNVNFTGNVMSQDFIEDEAIPMIKEAIRRGADIGVA
jgi:hypothetical protein